MGWHLAIALLFLQGYQTKGFSLQTNAKDIILKGLIGVVAEPLGESGSTPPAIFA
jgi:hypothetical protein